MSKLQVLLHAGLLGLIAQNNDCHAEVMTVLRAVDSCFCCVTMLMRCTVNEVVIMQAKITIVVYLSACDILSTSTVKELSKRLAAEEKNAKKKPKMNKSKRPAPTVQDTSTNDPPAKQQWTMSDPPQTKQSTRQQTMQPPKLSRDRDLFNDTTSFLVRPSHRILTLK